MAATMRRAAALAALCALLLAGLIPSGFMPHAREGSVALVICTGEGAVAATPALGGDENGGDGQAAGMAGCPFTAAAQACPLPAAAVAGAPARPAGSAIMPCSLVPSCCGAPRAM